MELFFKLGQKGSNQLDKLSSRYSKIKVIDVSPS